MDESQDAYERRLADALERTVVVRPPRQSLATFGTTSVRYYLITEPAFADMGLPTGSEPESVVREGVVEAARPQVVTPGYLLRHEGFGENAARYLEDILRRHGPDAPGLLYAYRNEPAETSVVSGGPDEVAARLAERLDREDKRLAAVVRGVDALWDASLMKFIHELTASSLRSNVSELHSRGLLQMDGAIPRDARERVERMLEEARRGERQPAEVHRELERWGLFEEYQDRFLALFRGRSRR
jgi:hypothetical protein